MALDWALINMLASVVLQNVIIGVLLMATPKRSLYRYLAIPFLIWNMSRFLSDPIDASTYVRNNTTGNVVIAVLTALNILLINPLDERDLAREMPTTFFRSGHLYYTFEIIAFTRGIRTPRQVKNIPSQPAYYDRYGGKIPVGRYLLRQVVIMLWQFLVVDIVQVASAQIPQEPGFQEIEYLNVPAEKWIERLITNNLTWFFVARMMIDCSFRLASIIFVSLGLDEPCNWPPVFGRMKDAYTLRGFWGKLWHQMLRQPFTSMSNFLARDVLHLPRPSILERYTNIFIVFFLSALLHLFLDYGSGIPWALSGSMHFFLSFAFGIMIEDGVQALWNQFSPPQKSEDGETQTPLWKKMVGMVWVFAFIGVFSTPYVERMTQLPPSSMIPLTVVEKLGIELAGGLVCVGGVLLWFTVAPEI